MYVWSFCLLHRAQLVAKAMIKVLDNWEWNGIGVNEIPSTSYFNGVSNIASQWRSPGGPSKIKRAAETEFSSEVAVQSFSAIPGRCLRGRWLSIDSVETIICRAAPFIGKVFGSLWGYYCGEGGALPIEGPAPAAVVAPKPAKKKNTTQGNKRTRSSHRSRGLSKPYQRS